MRRSWSCQTTALRGTHLRQSRELSQERRTFCDTCVPQVELLDALRNFMEMERLKLEADINARVHGYTQRSVHRQRACLVAARRD